MRRLPISSEFGGNSEWINNWDGDVTSAKLLTIFDKAINREFVPDVGPRCVNSIS